ncbi:MAG: prepilin-type N-terminal cleavage/methylation domain-containing protein [Planctomycetes bacterium]|nr:prepilin-type N-terminal cleavage/methylation domain-containing protein [Planctomycetota bacterium]
MPGADGGGQGAAPRQAGLTPRRGFTLVEALVVVAVIGVLVAITLPGLSSARDTARTCQCTCQMRTLGMLAASHAEETREMPRSQHSALSHRVQPWGYAFFESLTGAPFRTKDAQWAGVFNGPYRCPLDRRTERWSYGYNVYFELAREETHWRTWRTLSALRSPARTVVFAELNNTTTADHAMAHFWTQFGAPPEIDGDRHRPGTGAAFADGHAESADFASLFDPDTGRDCFNPATAR